VFFFDHIAVSRCAERPLDLDKSRPKRRPGRAPAQAKSGARTASSGLSLRSNQDRRIAPGVRLLRPNRGLVPRQAVFLFGQIRTDASLQACAYSGRIVASSRVKRSFSSVTTISDRLGARAQGDPCLGCHLPRQKAPRRLGPPPKGWPSFDKMAKAFLKRK
jgi:hypothetical protein